MMDHRRRLALQYQELMPLFEYLRVRLKYDTVRWIRAFASKDDIVFTTRIKTFSRIYDKIVRKKIQVTGTTSLVDIILNEKGTLDDVVAIRFICFDAHQILRLVSHFVTTPTVAIRDKGFYSSTKGTFENPIHQFLLANGFKEDKKGGRDYEDVNFVLKFNHPIDTFFNSGKTEYNTYAQRIGKPANTEKQAVLKKLYEELILASPNLVNKISEFPIECQIVTATQHIYNRTQRPFYEYVIQSKDDSLKSLIADAEALTSILELMKLNLGAVDHSQRLVHAGLGVKYGFVPNLVPGRQFDLDGRLPAAKFELNHDIMKLNSLLSNDVLVADKISISRVTAINAMLSLIDSLSNRIVKLDRLATKRSLLCLASPKSLSDEEILYWSVQRIVLLCICNILLFANDSESVTRVLEALNEVSTETVGESFPSANIALGRIFERIEAMDRAVSQEIRSNDRAISVNAVVSPAVFSDPIVPWRYASFLYRSRDYAAALLQMRIGLVISEDLNYWRHQGFPVGFEVPGDVLFRRRSVEYQICEQISHLKYNIATVAGIFEICSTVSANSDEWISALQDIAQGTTEPSEKARAVCYQILICVCVASVGGAGAKKTLTINSRLKDEFNDIFRSTSREEINSLSLKTWWILCVCIIYPERSGEQLPNFKSRLSQSTHHPPEWLRFQAICGELVELWILDFKVTDDRQVFVERSLDLLKMETSNLLKESGAAELKGIVEQLQEIKSLIRDGSTTELKKKVNLVQKIGENLIVEGTSKILIDAIFHGFRAILG